MSILEELIEELKYHDLRQVAKKVCVSERTLHNWINGKCVPLLSTVELVANTIGLKLRLVNNCRGE